MRTQQPGRRSAIIGLAAFAGMTARSGPAISGPALAGAMPDGAILLVAGPAGGRADRWADALSPPLSRSLQTGAALTRQNVGGADGVTGANQFEALAAPDGGTALLVPGTAALSWLAGEARVRFDAARWLPVWAGSTGAVLASRVRPAPGRPIRLAVSSVIGPELAALLTLELMGVEVVPVPPAATAAAALLRPDIDAVFLSGPGVREDAAVLAEGGMTPVLTLGTLDAAGQSMRDSGFPDQPSAHEAIARAGLDPQPGLLAALRAVAAAAQLDVALVLPQLCPAAMVAMWRRGCAALAQAPSVQTEAARTGARPLGAQGAVISTATIAADVPTLLTLRRWLATRHGWQPA